MRETGDTISPGFNASLAEFVQNIACRKPATPAELDEIYRLRYRAYDRAGVLNPGAPEYFKDDYDDAGNASLFGMYREERLAGTIRIHVANSQNPILPSRSAFADFLDPLLGEGMTIVDPTRLVVSEAHARLIPKLPYIAIRIPWMACEHYGATHIIATMARHHQPFWRRIFGVPSINSEPRRYPGISVPITLHVFDFLKDRERVYERYPYLRSTPSERVALFGDAAARNEGLMEAAEI